MFFFSWQKLWYCWLGKNFDQSCRENFRDIFFWLDGRKILKLHAVLIVEISYSAIINLSSHSSSNSKTILLSVIRTTTINLWLWSSRIWVRNLHFPEWCLQLRSVYVGTLNWQEVLWQVKGWNLNAVCHYMCQLH